MTDSIQMREARL